MMDVASHVQQPMLWGRARSTTNRPGLLRTEEEFSRTFRAPVPTVSGKPGQSAALHILL